MTTHERIAAALALRDRLTSAKTVGEQDAANTELNVLDLSPWEKTEVKQTASLREQAQREEEFQKLAAELAKAQRRTREAQDDLERSRRELREAEEDEYRLLWMMTEEDKRRGAAFEAKREEK